jgi:hypothetical protein
LYRIISILADVSGAFLAKVDRQRDRHSKWVGKYMRLANWSRLAGVENMYFY